MENLLNLLNEYMFVDTSVCEHIYNKDVETIYVRTTLETGEIDDERVRDEWIISKRFGFIKWLVDNDKINFIFVERIGSGDFFYDTAYYNRCTCEDLEEYDEVDRVLMLLAIQDEPIEFLISILK